MKTERYPKVQKPAHREAVEALADDLYSLLCDARFAKFSLNDLLEGYFDKAPDGSQQCGERLMSNFGRAEMQARIAMDYLCRLADALVRFDAEAGSYTHQQPIADCD